MIAQQVVLTEAHNAQPGDGLQLGSCRPNWRKKRNSMSPAAQRTGAGHRDLAWASIDKRVIVEKNNIHRIYWSS